MKRHLPGEVSIICLTNTSRFPVFLRGFFQLSWPWPHISLPIGVFETLCGDAEASETPTEIFPFWRASTKEKTRIPSKRKTCHTTCHVLHEWPDAKHKLARCLHQMDNTNTNDKDIVA